MLHSSFVSQLPLVARLLKERHIKSAYAFGSVLTERFNEDSDLDLLISFEKGLDPLKAGELWWSLNEILRSILNREIDLVTEESLRNPYFIEELEEKKQLIYAA